jgi:hypothetical protein
MNIQDFKNNANALLMVTSDDWSKNFIQSLLDQVNAGRTLSEKQLNLFNKKLDNMLNPPEPVEVDQEFLKQINLLKTKTKSAWLLGFCDSITTQLKGGKTLSGKQMDIFKAKYDKLVLKIKPPKEIQSLEEERRNDSGWNVSISTEWNHSWICEREDSGWGGEREDSGWEGDGWGGSDGEW